MCWLAGKDSSNSTYNLQHRGLVMSSKTHCLVICASLSFVQIGNPVILGPAATH